MGCVRGRRQHCQQPVIRSRQGLRRRPELAWMPGRWSCWFSTRAPVRCVRYHDLAIHTMMKDEAAAIVEVRLRLRRIVPHAERAVSSSYIAVPTAVSAWHDGRYTYAAVALAMWNIAARRRIQLICWPPAAMQLTPVRTAPVGQCNRTLPQEPSFLQALRPADALLPPQSIECHGRQAWQA